MRRLLTPLTAMIVAAGLTADPVRWTHRWAASVNRSACSSRA